MIVKSRCQRMFIVRVMGNSIYSFCPQRTGARYIWIGACKSGISALKSPFTTASVSSVLPMGQTTPSTLNWASASKADSKKEKRQISVQTRFGIGFFIFTALKRLRQIDLYTKLT
jgi:hypothetical protein